MENVSHLRRSALYIIIRLTGSSQICYYLYSRYYIFFAFGYGKEVRGNRLFGESRVQILLIIPHTLITLG